MLVNTKEMLEKAGAGGYAIAQPNAWDMHSLRAIVRASQVKRAPVIIGVAEVHMPYINLDEMAAMVKYYSEKSDIPLALHLDHGNTYSTLVKAIRAGFTSVMIDASSDKYEDNVRKTIEIVKISHECGVTVEAELGHVGSGSDYEKIDGELKDVFTNPQKAKEFVVKTGVDSLAVAVGTAHGEYKGVPKLDFDRLKEIKKAVDVPLVLHGGSDTGDENLAKCIQFGISKINIATDLMKAASKRIQKDPSMNYVDLSFAGESAIKECLEHYFDVFECSGRVDDVSKNKSYTMLNSDDVSGQL